MVRRPPADFEERLRDLLATVDIARLAMRAQRDDSRIERLVRLAADIAGAECGALLLVDEDRGDLVVAAAVGPGAERLAASRMPIASGAAGAAVAGGEPIAVADAGDAPAADEIARRTGVPVRNLLAVPFDVYGAVAGVLELRNVPAERGFDPATIGRVSELARVAAAAVEDYRGDRFLFSLFASALPRALAPDATAAGTGLGEELRLWIESLRQSPAWRGAVALVEPIRDLMEAGEDGLRLCAGILEAVARRERSRRERFGGG